MRKRVACAAGVAMSLAVLSGCSSSSKSASGATSKTSAAALTGSPIKLFAVIDTSLIVGNPVADGISGAEKAINSAGGVDGHPIDVKMCSSSDPNQLVTCARQAVSGGYLADLASNSVNSAQFAPVLFDGGIPMVGNYPFSAAELSNRLSFPTVGGVLSPAGEGLQVVQQGGAKTVAIAYLDTPASAEAGSLAALGVKAGGGTSLGTTAVPASQTDYTSVIASIAAKHPGGIVPMFDPTNELRFIQAARQAGLNVPMSVNSGTFSLSSIKTLGSAANGLFVVTSYKPPDPSSTDPGVQQFLSEMKQVKTSAPLQETTEVGWASVHLMADVVKQMLAAGTTLTAANVVAQLNQGQTYNLGLIPPIQFKTTIKALPGLTRVFNPDVYFAKVQNGKLVSNDQPVNPLAP